MANYLIGTGDDLIDGMPDADTVTGPLGGTDAIDLGGGNDTVTYDQIPTYEIYYESDGFGGFYEYLVFFESSGPQFVGTLAGGSGIDTLSVGIAQERSGLQGRAAVSLSTATITGFEILETRGNVEMRLQDFDLFSTYRGDAAGNVLFRLAGPGGELDLREKTFDAETVNVDARGMQSRIIYRGSAADDVVTGTNFVDIIRGGAGDDTIILSGGPDTFFGDGGTDTLRIVWTGKGPLEFAARTEGSQTFLGTTFSGFEQFHVTGGLYADSIRGGDGSDVLSGGFNHDRLDGGRGDDTLYGGDGNDILIGGRGIDLMIGGADNDTYYVDTTADVVQEATWKGTDRVVTSVSYALSESAEIEQLQTISAAATNTMNLTGNGFVQTLIGNAGNNRLDGGGGADTMNGSFGDDTYIVDNAGDVVIEAAGRGTDKVIASVSYALSATAEVEFMQTNGAALTTKIDLTGSDTDQTILGNNGANRLDGKYGMDTLRGYGGADTFVFSSRLTSANVDTIVDFNVAQDTIELASAIFTGLTKGTTISTDQFAANTSGLATTADHRIVYETDTGNLYFDADGNGSGGRKLFGIVSTDLALTNDDFFVG